MNLLTSWSVHDLSFLIPFVATFVAGVVLIGAHAVLWLREARALRARPPKVTSEGRFRPRWLILTPWVYAITAAAVSG